MIDELMLFDLYPVAGHGLMVGTNLSSFESKKYALVGDYKATQFLGGAALVDSYVVESLRKRGYNIDHFAVNQQSTDWLRFRSSSYTGVVYTNLAGMTIDQLEWVCTEGPPYILFRHDIPTIVYRFSAASVTLQDVFKRLFNNARCSIFISDLQLRAYKTAVPLGHATVVPPPIDFAGFWTVKPQPRVGMLYLGPISELRGLRRSIEHWQASQPWAPFDAYGRIEDTALAEFAEKQGVRILPGVERRAVPNLMSRYSTLVHHPNFIDSFCIKIIEAEMCGMSLLVDREKIGRFSFAVETNSLAAYMENGACDRLSKIINAFL